jgi:hypothetical protein
MSDRVRDYAAGRADALKEQNDWRARGMSLRAEKDLWADRAERAEAKLAEAERRVAELEAAISEIYQRVRAEVPKNDRTRFTGGAFWALAVLEEAVRSRFHEDYYRIREALADGKGA